MWHAMFLCRRGACWVTFAFGVVFVVGRCNMVHDAWLCHHGVWYQRHNLLFFHYYSFTIFLQSSSSGSRLITSCTWDTCAYNLIGIWKDCIGNKIALYCGCFDLKTTQLDFVWFDLNGISRSSYSFKIHVHARAWNIASDASEGAASERHLPSMWYVKYDAWTYMCRTMSSKTAEWTRQHDASTCF